MENDVKYLVIGSTGYTGIDSVEWDEKNFPNIVDYDVIIVDVRALDERMLPKISPKRFEELRRQLTRLLHSNGRIIVLSDYKKQHENKKQYPSNSSNYDWCPIHIGISNESGDTLNIIQDSFNKYISHLKRWPYYFYVPSDCLTREITNAYGPTNSTKYNVPIYPFVGNRYDKTIAGSLYIEVTRKQRKSSGYEAYDHYPAAPNLITGEIVLLPLIEKLDHKEAVRLVLEDLVGSAFSYVPPSWIDSKIVPHTAEIEDEIKEKEQQKDLISSEIRELEAKRDQLNNFKKLLYASGHDLEEIVKFCFEELGAKVSPAKYGQEEYVLEYGGTEYLVEVKGVSKSISLSHIRQLNDYILKYEEDTGKACKGILFGNSWRTIPPEERNTKGMQEFPPNVISRSREWNISLVSSTKFFEAFCEFLLDRSKGDHILKNILNTSGLVDLNIDMDKKN